MAMGTYWLMALSLVAAAAFSRRWIASGLYAIALAASVPLACVGLKSGDYLHLFMLYPYYRTVINGTVERPVRFYWGDEALMIPDGFQLRTLIYDDSGGTERELNTARREDGLSFETTHFLGNFFMEHGRYADD